MPLCLSLLISKTGIITIPTSRGHCDTFICMVGGSHDDINNCSVEFYIQVIQQF